MNKTKIKGKVELGHYFSNYVLLPDWRFSMGTVEGRPAIRVRQPMVETIDPSYFILLEWRGAKVLSIRDFAHARYVTESAEIIEDL